MSSPVRKFLFTALVLAALPRSAHAQDATDLQVHGFVSQGFMMSTNNNYLGHSDRGSFEFFEAGINVSKQLRNDLRVGVQVFAQDLGPIGNYAPTIDWAMVDWKMTETVGIRAGRIKMPLGLYNENWDVDVSRTPVLLPQSVYAPRFRDTLNAFNGASVYGTTDLGGGGDLDWVGYAGTVTIPEHIGDLEIGNVFGARVIWDTPVTGLRVGGHYVYSNWLENIHVDPMTTIQMHVDNWMQIGVSAELTRGPLTLTVEARDWTGDVHFEPMIQEDSEFHTQGGYVMAQVQANDRLSFSGYYSLNFDNPDDRSNPDDFSKDAALGARFDITPEWTIKGEGHYVDGTAELDGDLNPDGEDRHWGLFLAKTSLAF